MRDALLSDFGFFGFKVVNNERRIFSKVVEISDFRI